VSNKEASAMAEPSGIAKLLKFFGKLPGQSLGEFKKDEWDKMTEKDRKQLINGIVDESLDYQS
jgi:hypothetical protein